MNVAFGLRAHSGWAALVVVGSEGGDLMVVDRCRLELVQESWQKQPYHAADGLAPAAARDLVKRGVDLAYRGALAEIRKALEVQRRKKNIVIACGVIISAPMPNWSTDEILAVHFRMHKAEGVLFKQALVAAAEKCGLKTVTITEKELAELAGRMLRTVTALGKTVGPPWAKDQKEASTAALIAMEGSR